MARSARLRDAHNWSPLSRRSSGPQLSMSKPEGAITCGMPTRPAASSRCGPAARLPPNMNSLTPAGTTSMHGVVQPLLDQFVHGAVAGAVRVPHDGVVAVVGHAVEHPLHAPLGELELGHRDQRAFVHGGLERAVAGLGHAAHAAGGAHQDGVAELVDAGHVDDRVHQGDVLGVDVERSVGHRGAAGHHELGYAEGQRLHHRRAHHRAAVAAHREYAVAPPGREQLLEFDDAPGDHHRRGPVGVGRRPQFAQIVAARPRHLGGSDVGSDARLAHHRGVEQDGNALEVLDTLLEHGDDLALRVQAGDDGDVLRHGGPQEDGGGASRRRQWSGNGCCALLSAA